MHGRAEKLRMQFFDQPQEALLPKTRLRVRLPGQGKIAGRQAMAHNCCSAIMRHSLAAY
jgi:hypothetical protein